MRGIIHQGESDIANVKIMGIEDGIAKQVAWRNFAKVEVYIIHESSYKTLAKYSYPSNSEYLEIEIVTDNDGNESGLIRFSSTETKNIPAGDIMAQVHLYIPNSGYRDDFITKIYKGKLAKIVRAKRKT